jgi:uncharacterized protein YcbX
MLFEHSSSGLKKLQLDSHPECALFATSLEPSSDGAVDTLVVQYVQPTTPVVPAQPEMSVPLRMPLEPDVANLERIDVNLHGSKASRAYLMGGEVKTWFSACFGREVEVVYLGDGAREVLGQTLLPTSYEANQEKPAQSWLGWASSAVLGGTKEEAARPTIAFSDVAPLLVVSEASVRNVTARLSDGEKMDVRKFRPNIVVDGEGEDAFAEDFWGELELSPTTSTASPPSANSTTLILTANCARCISLNVDYTTGKFAEGEMGTVLKKLMKDRRVDSGAKWSPIFGRYAFLQSDMRDAQVSVGDVVKITRRLEERTTWDWDITPTTAKLVAAQT